MKGACGSLAACLGSLGISVVAVTEWLQLLAALIAVLTGLLSFVLVWRKVRAGG